MDAPWTIGFLLLQRAELPRRFNGHFGAAGLLFRTEVPTSRLLHGNALLAGQDGCSFPQPTSAH